METDFRVGDLVEIYNRIIAEITYIDYENKTADVEWDGGMSYTNCDCVPFRHMTLVKR